MQKQLLSNVHKIEETLFSLLCMWYGGKGATWGTLLQALRAAELNAQATACWIGGESGRASVCCIVMVERDECTGVCSSESSQCW